MVDSYIRYIYGDKRLQEILLRVYMCCAVNCMRKYSVSDDDEKHDHLLVAARNTENTTSQFIYFLSTHFSCNELQTWYKKRD